MSKKEGRGLLRQRESEKRIFLERQISGFTKIKIFKRVMYSFYILKT